MADTRRIRTRAVVLFDALTRGGPLEPAWRALRPAVAAPDPVSSPPDLEELVAAAVGECADSVAFIVVIGEDIVHVESCN